jgi:pantoate--beta-alanine ligase
LTATSDVPRAGRVEGPVVVRTRAELRNLLATLPRPIGLVPTMGWLHAGHRSLIRRSRAENATTVVTNFVNPKQFNSPDDLARYPRDEVRDLAIIAEEGVDVVFAPHVDEVYPPGFETVVSVGRLAGVLEGAARPGHFDGVATVVTILFNAVGADMAYFGQKDAQQVMVISRMARDLGIATRVVPCPTVREHDGLALSSRNALLSPEGRAAAPVVHLALLSARDQWLEGERSAEALRAEMRRVLAAEPLAEPEYVSVASLEPGRELEELVTVDGPALLSTAVRFGEIRLIDNERLD